MAVPYAFASQSGKVPASELDDNFAYLNDLLQSFLDSASPSPPDGYFNDVHAVNVIASGAVSGASGAFATLAVSNPCVFAVNRNNVDFNLADSAITQVDFTTKDLDTNNSYDLATDRFTPPAGYYHFSGVATALGTVDGGEMACSLFKNGVAYCNGARINMSSATQEAASVLSVEMHLNGTDYVDFRVYQDNPSMTTLLFSGALNELRFSGFRFG